MILEAFSVRREIQETAIEEHILQTAVSWVDRNRSTKFCTFHVLNVLELFLTLRHEYESVEWRHVGGLL